MVPRDTTNQALDDSGDDDFGIAFVELRVSMTVVLARAQLLRRRIRSGQVHDVHQCLETLASIDWAVRAMEARLREIETRLEE